MNKVTELTIDRLTWLRGDDGTSQLYRRSDGKMCCLGFFCLARGVPLDKIAGYDTPASLTDSNKFLPELVTCGGGNNHVCQDLMTANDSKELKEGEREKRVRDGFAKIGVNVTFIC